MGFGELVVPGNDLGFEFQALQEFHHFCSAPVFSGLFLRATRLIDYAPYFDA
jgi:hypothetical protein